MDSTRCVQTIKGIKNVCQCNVEIRRRKDRASVGDPVRVVS